MNQEYQPSAEKQADPVPELIELLGGTPVLIAWPRGSKGTPQKWGHLTSAEMTPEYLARLRHGNIGVALGRVSGGLCAIDIDDDQLVQPLLEANPELRETLQTHGARGRVFWLRITGDYPKGRKLKTVSGEIGEFRPDGNQSIIWGIHPNTGKAYTFVVKKHVVAVAFDSIKWPEAIVNPPTLQRGQRNRSRLCSSVALPAPSSLPTPSLCVSVKSIEEAVEVSLPEKEHQNNSALFKLARALLALKASNQERTRAFELWYKEASARGVLRPDQSKDEYLVEFMNACRKAKIPLGGGPAEIAWKRAETEPLPAEALRFTSNAGKLLVALCWQMHKLDDGKPWFLPTRIVAKLTGKTHTTIASWLSALVEMGIIEIVEKHTNTRATRFRYVAQHPSHPNETET